MLVFTAFEELQRKPYFTCFALLPGVLIGYHWPCFQGQYGVMLLNTLKKTKDSDEKNEH